MVIINGEEKNAAGKTIADLISEGGYKPERVAVERNLEIVPKSAYSDTVLMDGDRVEIVSFVGGG